VRNSEKQRGTVRAVRSSHPHETDTYAHVFLCLPSLGEPEHEYEAIDDEYGRVAPLLMARNADRAASRKKVKADWEVVLRLMHPVVNMSAACYAKLSSDQRMRFDAMVWQTRSIAVRMGQQAELLESKRSSLREYVAKQERIVVTESSNAFALEESKLKYKEMLEKFKVDFDESQEKRVKDGEAAVRTLHEGVQKLASGSPRKKMFTRNKRG
jgi:hypothetical protein